jgi:hypothetical protein
MNEKVSLWLMYPAIAKQWKTQQLFFKINKLSLSPSFACPKEGARKGHPSFTSAFGGYIVLLAVVGTLKNSASPQTVLTSYSSNCCDAQRERMGLKKNVLSLSAHYHFAEFFKNRRKQREDCLRPLKAGEFRSARLFLK